MTEKNLVGLANTWIDAFNQKDLEILLSLYDEHAEHYSPKLKLRQPETHGYIKGKKALRTWWRDAFDRLPTLHYELVRLTPAENRVFMEYVRHVAGEEDLYVGEMLELRDGLIIASAVFHR
jgi:hypothetical protein